VGKIQFASTIIKAHGFKVMSDRELVLDAVRDMPETASLHDIMDELLLLDEVKKRLAKSERGESGIPHEEAVKMLDSWIIK
jgi:hypothetical protein